MVKQLVVLALQAPCPGVNPQNHINSEGVNQLYKVVHSPPHKPPTLTYTQK